MATVKEAYIEWLHNQEDLSILPNDGFKYFKAGVEWQKDKNKN